MGSGCKMKLISGAIDNPVCRGTAQTQRAGRIEWLLGSRKFLLSPCGVTIFSLKTSLGCKAKSLGESLEHSLVNK